MTLVEHGTPKRVSRFDWSVTGVSEVVCAFARLDVPDELADVSPSVLNGALLILPHPVFDLGEGLFDRIEVGRVWRQVPEPGASGFDYLPDGFRLVASEIVENDDVAFAQGWREKMLDIGVEAFTVDRPVEDAGCGELVVAERADERQGSPVAVRREAAQAGPFGAQPRNGAMLVLIQV